MRPCHSASCRHPALNLEGKLCFCIVCTNVRTKAVNDRVGRGRVMAAWVSPQELGSHTWTHIHLRAQVQVRQELQQQQQHQEQ
jgi:hypothetical protein